ncbi:MAG: hypothetical protein IJC17_05980 [Clostridia bacterium]|nr:hypothetical protein [Clostridia bacterium]
MKRVIGLMVALILLVGLTGCAVSPTADARMKLGLGADAVYTVSADGKATVETTWAAVVLDAADRIVSCRIDSIKADSMPGAADVSLKTKYELKENYGMVAYGPAEKEWYEQVDIFCKAVEGKTLEEAMNLKAGEADLSAGCTISVMPFQYALAKACQSAVAVEAAAADALAMTLSGSVSASEKADEFEFLATASTSADGRFTACAIDAVQVPVPLEKGAYAAESSATFKTKRELGFDYGMVAYAGAKYEWFEQMDALQAAAVGKTPNEVLALVGENGKVVPDIDLASKATVYVGGIVGQLAATVAE